MVLSALGQSHSPRLWGVRHATGGALWQVNWSVHVITQSFQSGYCGMYVQLMCSSEHVSCNQQCFLIVLRIWGATIRRTLRQPDRKLTRLTC